MFLLFSIQCKGNIDILFLGFLRTGGSFYVCVTRCGPTEYAFAFCFASECRIKSYRNKKNKSVFFFLFVCTTFLYEYMKSVKKRLKIPKG